MRIWMVYKHIAAQHEPALKVKGDKVIIYHKPTCPGDIWIEIWVIHLLEKGHMTL